MANLNLSEFTEKLFVADADHTFIWDTAASISKRVSRNSWLNSGTLTSDAPVTISQTWNNAAVAFTGLKVNAVSTASASGSLLLDLQVGGTSQFTVRKDGAITTQAIFALNTSLQFIFAGNRSVMLGIGDLRVSGSSTIGWSSNGTHADGGPPDTILLRDGAANTLALRNGAAAQRFNVYNSYLNAGVDYERMGIGDIPAIAGNVGLYYARAGSGAAKGIYIWNDSNSSIVLSTNATNRWQILNTGHLHAWTDNQFDIGASGANRPRNVYVGNYVFPQTGVLGTAISFIVGRSGGSYFQFDGVEGISIIGVAEVKINFGGSTNLFPAIKRSSTTLQARLANDSAFAAIQGKLTTDTAFTATTVTPTGFITLYDSTGTAYKVPCVPA